jgi:hypothetical protein
MEDRSAATVHESSSEGESMSAQVAERVVSILDFDESGVITCLAKKPFSTGLARIRDSRSTRSISVDEWNVISSGRVSY